MPESRLRFLVIRLSSIGDIVHTLPAVAALGCSYPQAQIHWAVEDRYSELLRGNPFVGHVIRLDTLGWRKNLASSNTIAAIMESLEALREFRYDAVIDFQGLMKSALLARLAHSQKRIGLAWQWLREPLAAAFYTHRVSPRNCKHVIEINLSLVESLGASSPKWEFPLPESFEDKAAVEEQLRALGTKDYMIVNPGGGWKSKRWSPANYAEVAARLARQVPFDVLVTGSPQEENLAREILARADTPRAKWFPSTLLQFIALARNAKLLIGGDTGPLHLAAAVRTPLVAIFDSSDPRNTPERNGPFDPADIILCDPERRNHAGHSKHLNHLEGVSVDSVVKAALQRLGTAHE
ncbi:MAG: lipopolysaccharide heptosyltransferase I [Acidobacteriota bacterium]